MYLKSTHSPLVEGGHKWEITLFCSSEANTISHVDISPKSRGSRVVPNDARPAPTAYTMTYTSSKYDELPIKFIAVITFKTKVNGKNKTKTLKVPANIATDRKRRKADGLEDDDDDDNDHDDYDHDHAEVEEEMNEKVIMPPPVPKKKKRALCSVFYGSKNRSISEKDSAPESCCCTIM